MSSPTIGRIVHFWPAEDDKVARSNNNDGPVAAVITAIFSDEIVNLMIFPDYNASPIHRTSIKLGNVTSKERPIWVWPEIK